MKSLAPHNLSDVMVNSEELRKWANEYRIRQKAPSDGWASARQTTFEHIIHLCRTNVQDYNACSVRDSKEPWNQHNVNKAMYLSKKASFLNERSANESAWRHGIEGVKCRGYSIKLLGESGSRSLYLCHSVSY